MTQTVILIEVDVTSPAGVVSTLRFADRAIRPMPPTDALRPNVAWDDCLLEAPTIRRALFEDFALLTPGLGVGAMKLANGHGGLDAYQAHVWGQISVKRWTEGTPFSTAVEIFRGLASTPRFSHSTSEAGQVTVGFYDYRAELDTPVQATTYAGTNGTGGVLYEGAADGLKGKPKPLAYGNLIDAHLPAPQVNGAIRAHQLHAGAVNGSIAIFDRGAAAGFADQGDRVGAVFDAFNPAAASYTTDKGRGLLKINGDPVGALSFGCQGDSTPTYVDTVGPITARILTKAGVPAGRIGASVSALAATASVGVFAADQISAADMIKPLTRAALAALIPDRLGVWQATPIAPPAAVADLTLLEDQIKDLQADESAPAPAGIIRVGYGKIWTTFSGGDLAPALRNTAAAEKLGSTWRWAVLEDAAVKARLPGAWRTIEIETALRSEADALALANQLKALFGLRSDGAPRRQWKVTVELTDEALALPLGKTVRLVYPPRGLDVLLLLLGEEPGRPSRDLAIWTLWG
ncbi:hypothetical protein [Caulobacter henricii]|uniref:Tip attachment protein J domain-containing protein n=1 Tax=Caulobacter henricii TaxID=69395 RepID=A0A0P0P1L7_9CAUL|nr:hypothetical protein [Caulobacter henricii]ALL14256.1 hypothetical protein AQ619_13400 [Caulobacter henricii]